MFNTKYGTLIYMVWGIANFLLAMYALPSEIVAPVFKAIMFFAIGQHLCGKAIAKFKKERENSQKQ